MQRIRPTERGIQLTQGDNQLDVLTIERSLHPVYGDSVGFWLKGSLANATDILHGSDRYSTFDVTGGDNIADFARYLPKLVAKSTESTEIHDFPESSQVFEEHTVDKHKTVGCVALETDEINSRRATGRATDRATDDLLEYAGWLVANLSTLLGIDEDPVERVDVRAFAYPLGIQPGFTPVLLAEQTSDNLKLYFDQNSRTRLPEQSSDQFAAWVAGNVGQIERKSVWG